MGMSENATQQEERGVRRKAMAGFNTNLRGMFVELAIARWASFFFIVSSLLFSRTLVCYYCLWLHCIALHCIGVSSWLVGWVEDEAQHRLLVTYLVMSVDGYQFQVAYSSLIWCHTSCCNCYHTTVCRITQPPLSLSLARSAQHNWLTCNACRFARSSAKSESPGVLLISNAHERNILTYYNLLYTDLGFKVHNTHQTTDTHTHTHMASCTTIQCNQHY
jgi:hypothetical protein